MTAKCNQLITKKPKTDLVGVNGESYQKRWEYLAHKGLSNVWHKEMVLHMPYNKLLMGQACFVKMTR